jgi:hypothetical protein
LAGKRKVLGEEMPEDKKFLGENWLLHTKEAIELYHEIAIPLRRGVGIVDTHTHHNLRQIVKNRPFPNIWRAEVLEPRDEYANNDHHFIQLATKIHWLPKPFHPIVLYCSPNRQHSIVWLQKIDFGSSSECRIKGYIYLNPLALC